MKINRKQFKTWLFKQPKRKSFKYLDHHDCMLGTFLQSLKISRNVINVGSYGFFVKQEGSKIPKWLLKILDVRRPQEADSTRCYVKDAQKQYLKQFPLEK